MRYKSVQLVTIKPLLVVNLTNRKSMDKCEHISLTIDESYQNVLIYSYMNIKLATKFWEPIFADAAASMMSF